MIYEMKFAPRDGTRILVHTKDNITCIAHYGECDIFTDQYYLNKKLCWIVFECEYPFYSILINEDELFAWQHIPKF
jgi:hypothetical protein